MQTLRQHIELAIPKGLTSEQLREDFILRVEEQVNEYTKSISSAQPVCGETAGVGTGDLLGPIYLVICGWDHEGDDVKAILRTKEEADAVAEKYRNSDLFSYDEVRVQEWHVGEITDRRWEKSSPNDVDQPKP